MNVLGRYILAATFARTSTGGSALAIVLISRDFGADGTLVGALSACLTAPHVLGPVYGKWCEKVNNAFIIISMSCLFFAAFFQLALISFEWQQLWLTFIALIFCGMCSSFMMGGLSTQLVYLVANDVQVRRRTQSWDTLTYGIGLTAGPLLIALLSKLYSTKLAVSASMALPAIAGLIILSLPKYYQDAKMQMNSVPNLKSIVKLIWQKPELKTTLLMTSVAAFSIAALPVVAVYYSEVFQQGRENGAYLLTLYGMGCLCGAALILFRPLLEEALTLLKNVGWVLVACLVIVSLSHSFMMSMFAYWFCGVANSVFFAITIAARTEYSPALGATQIYMWVAAAKITAASVGAFVAGYLVDYDITLPLLASITTLSLTLIILFYPIKKQLLIPLHRKA